MEVHDGLLKEIQDSPTDVNAVVARRRKDFTGEFFRYLTTLSETYDSLEGRDGNHFCRGKWFDSEKRYSDDHTWNGWFLWLHVLW